MDALQIILAVVGLILTLGSGVIGHLITGHGTPRTVGRGIRSLALPKVNITWLDVIYGSVMIVGIVAKEIWDNINETGAANIKIPRLIAALLVSPIIYSAVYSKFVKDELSLLGLAVAFQNGFFWQAVFRTAQGSS